MTLRSSRRAFLRHHLCEVILFAALAAPVLYIRPSLNNVLAVTVFAVLYAGIGYASDMPTRLHIDDDGLFYLEGGRDQRFLAWSEIGCLVPRSFRGWPAENAVVVLDHDGRPLLVASTVMFSDADVAHLLDAARSYVKVDEPVALSPFTARANGCKRPDLAPERTSERFLASSVGGLFMTLVVGVAIFTLVGR